jgi:ADP-ribose pyrophosphatase YjhB (NUDIX family)
MHPLEKFQYCPICGSRHFVVNDNKSKICTDCGFIYYLNPSSATVAFILNEKNELLVETRKNNPAKGTLDLPGGFADIGETSEQGIIREVMEELCLEVTEVRYLFSIPNTYNYSGFNVPTLDMFYRCQVRDYLHLQAMDDAANVKWIALKDIRIEDFGLHSIRQGLENFIKNTEL